MRVRLVGIAAIAIVAGLGAGFMVMKLVNKKPETVRVVESAPQIEMVDVLVASRDIPMGGRTQEGDFRWTSWPKQDLPDYFITRTTRPSAPTELTGTIARAALLTGEPIREAKMMKADRGFMSVILSPGMRAIALEVKAQSTAGGFILPNDHVDIILTRATKGTNQGDSYTSETILTNVRVLAIDQTITEKEGQAAVIAKDTATLELSPSQAEMLTQAQQSGTISLTLRALRDADGATTAVEKEESSSVKVVRFGFATRTTASQ